MNTATYPDGKEVTPNKSKFKIFPQAYPKTLLWKKLQPESEMSIPNLMDNNQGQEENKDDNTTDNGGRNRPRRTIKKIKRLIEA